MGEAPKCYQHRGLLCEFTDCPILTAGDYPTLRAARHDATFARSQGLCESYLRRMRSSTSIPGMDSPA
jgi:hypothetical protein